MGIFGKNRTMQFFISDNDMKIILNQILQKSVVLIKGDFFENKEPIIIQDATEIEWPTPFNDPNWWIWDKDIGKLSIDNNRIDAPPSPIIQVRRCRIKDNTLLSGSIGTLISYYNNQNEEIMKSEAFINWWKEVRKYFKRGLVICVTRENDKEYNSIFWASPGAIELYKSGIEFRQIAGTPFTFHPKI